jgi:tetraacyldisaccharide 4'-kinase
MRVWRAREPYLNIEHHWYRDSFVSRLLTPLSWLYCLLVFVRRALYRAGILRVTRLPVPVVVVGNLTVGGSGKTPLVIWLARFLREQGWRPGIVTRGYGGQAARWPQTVTPESDPESVGDEPVLLAREAGCPVVADPDRVRAAERLVRLGCNIVVSDDGLQHYRLARDFEIAVIDGARRFGNGRCLPAGPLREPVSRLKEVQARVTLGEAQAGEWAMALEAKSFHRLEAPEATAEVDRFQGQPMHAVAGIGHPARFFDQLRRLGLDIVPHPFPDHHRFRERDLVFGDAHETVMTQKDAVKCERLAGVTGWYLAVEVRPDPAFAEFVQRWLKERTHG